MIFLPLNQLQPSQLYISQDKLERILASFPSCQPETLVPIPIIRLDGAIVLTDGHTRACAALLSGGSTLPVIWDQDELDLEAYRICVQWCREESVTSILSLSKRIIPGDEFRVRWIERCQGMHRQLESLHNNQT